jgi:hypothetical protein
MIDQFDKIEIACEFLKLKRLRRAQREIRAQNHVCLVSCTHIIPQKDQEESNPFFPAWNAPADKNKTNGRP